MIIDIKRGFSWVFVGCGGTFSYLAPILRSWFDSGHIEPSTVTFVDPDYVNLEVPGRQWGYYNHEDISQPEDADGERDLEWFKTDLAHSVITPNRAPRSSRVKFQEGGYWYELKDHDQVVLVVSVDNDEARLSCAEFCSEHPGLAVMVVNGCDRVRGQCYYGIWEGGKPIHDWRGLHRDVVGRGRSGQVPEKGCNEQTALANLRTATVTAHCLDHLIVGLESETMVKEFYWEGKHSEMWSGVVTRFTQRYLPETGEFEKGETNE